MNMLNDWIRDPLFGPCNFLSEWSSLEHILSYYLVLDYRSTYTKALYAM